MECEDIPKGAAGIVPWRAATLKPGRIALLVTHSGGEGGAGDSGAGDIKC